MKIKFVNFAKAFNIVFYLPYLVILTTVITGCAKYSIVIPSRIKTSAGELRQIRRLQAKAEEIKNDSTKKDIFDSIFIEEKTDYDKIDFLTLVNGKLAYRVKEGNKWFVVFDGKKGKEYDSVRFVRELNNKLYYLAGQGDKHYVVFGDKEILLYEKKALDYVYKYLLYIDGEVKDTFDRIYFDEPVVIGENLAFFATKDRRGFIIFDSKIIGEKYESISRPRSINNKLAFSVFQKEPHKVFVVYDGEIIGQKYRSVSVQDIKEFEDGIVYSAFKGLYPSYKDSKELMVFNNKEEKEYDAVSSPIIINGKVFYAARQGQKNYVIFDNKKHEVDYDIDHNSLREINEKVFYLADQGGKNYVIFDNKKYEIDYYIDYNTLTEINGVLTYIAKQDRYGPGEFVVFGDEKGKEHERIRKPLIEVNGKLAYIAEGKGRVYVIYDGKVINQYNSWGTYHYMKYPVTRHFFKEVDGKLSYCVKKGHHFILVFDGKEVGIKYGSSRYPKLINGKLSYWVVTGRLYYGIWFCVYDDREIRAYSRLEKPIIVEGKQVLAGYRDNTWFIIREK